MTEVVLPQASTAQQRAVWLVMLLGFLITFMVWQALREADEQQARVAFESHVESIAQTISRRMQAHRVILLSGASLFDASNDVSRDEWHRFVSRLDLTDKFPGIQGMGFTVVVKPGDVAAHEAAVRAEGFPAYRISPPGQRDLYTSIIYLEPFTGRNLAAFGYDMFSEATRRAAMQRAVDEFDTTLSAPVTLVQENQGQVQPGFLMYEPVFRKNMPTDTREQRWQALQGFVYSPFRALDLMNGIFPYRDADVDFSVYDTDAGSQANLLFATAGGQTYRGIFETTRELNFYGRQWILKAHSSAAFDAQYFSNLNSLVLILGIALSIALFLVLRGQVSARHHAERIVEARTRELRRIMSLNDSILHNAAFSIISTTREGVITSFNPSSERMLGYTAEEMVGKQTPAIIHLPEEVAQRAREFSEELGVEVSPGFETFVVHTNLKRDNEHEWTYVRKDGTRFPVLLSVSAWYDDEGAIAGYVGFASDITERKREQRELVDAREAAEAASRAKSEFLANMSHEIRTPLNAVLGLTRIVLGTELGAKQRGYLNKVLGASTTLLGILNDILDYSKIEAGKLTIEHVDFELTDIFESASVLFAMPAEEKQVDLSFDIDPSLPTSLSGDPLRLGQIVNNLVSNAIKFTHRGEVRVSAKRKFDRDGRALLEISVADTGIGITPEQIARLFQSFTQADSSTTRNYGGTGLGLAICKRLVQLMGGDIQVSSEADKGSRFVFSVPLQLAARTTVGRSVARLRHMKVLLVCEQASTRQSVQTILNSWQFDVVSASDMDDALMLLTAAASSGAAFDLLMFDSSVAPASCLDDVQRLRDQEASESLARHRVIAIVTAHDRALLLHAPLLREFDGLLEKPVLPSHLFDLMISLQQGRGMATTSAVMPTGIAAMPAFRGQRVLLVEDNALNQLVARELLEELGLSVDVAENGVQAVDMACNEDYAVILMDLHMPQMDGLTAARQIRTCERGRDVPIVAMTAAAMQQDREATRAAGMNAHISKPIDPAELARTLQLWIKASEPTRAAESVERVDSMALSAGATAGDEWLSLEQLSSLLPDADVRAALARVRKLPRYRELLKSFALQYPQLRAQFAECSQIGDNDRLYRLAHDLKAVAGNVGFDALSTAAADVCVQIKTQQTPTSVPALLDCLDRALVQLQRLPL